MTIIKENASLILVIVMMLPLTLAWALMDEETTIMHDMPLMGRHYYNESQPGGGPLQLEQRRNLGPNNIACHRLDGQDVCHIQARLDGNPLEMTTYCPLGSDSLGDCTCDVTHFGHLCNSCSYCVDEQVFIVDCSNVITNAACASVSCQGYCLARGTGTTPRGSRTSYQSHKLSHDAVAAIVVFSTMCCLPCLTALICARILPSSSHDGESFSSNNNHTTYFGNPQQRQTVIDQCLLTKKITEDSSFLAEEESAIPSTIMTCSSSTCLEEKEDLEASVWIEENGTRTILGQETENEKEEANCSQDENEEAAAAVVEQRDETNVENAATNADQGGATEEEEEEDAGENRTNQQTMEDENNDHAEDDDICQICLDPYRAGDERSWSKVSKCRHSFHKDCITTWLQRHDDCPSCRAKFLSVLPQDEEEDCNI